jgi:hypothetical protein
MRAEAVLVGTLLIIDGRLWATDVDFQEAADIVAELEGPNAPTQVTVQLGIKRKRKSVTGWPEV